MMLPFSSLGSGFLPLFDFGFVVSGVWLLLFAIVMILLISDIKSPDEAWSLTAADARRFFEFELFDEDELFAKDELFVNDELFANDELFVSD